MRQFVRAMFILFEVEIQEMNINIKMEQLTPREAEKLETRNCLENFRLFCSVVLNFVAELLQEKIAKMRRLGQIQ